MNLWAWCLSLDLDTVQLSKGPIVDLKRDQKAAAAVVYMMWITLQWFQLTLEKDLTTLLSHKLVSLFKHHFWSHIPTLKVFTILTN